MSFEEQVLQLLASFPNSTLLYNKNEENEVLQLEVVVHQRSNTYVGLTDCKNVTGLKRCVIEQLSRPITKGVPYSTERKNKEFRESLLKSLNRFLKTNFTMDDMDFIYTYLGNGIRHTIATQFVEHDFDMNWLKEQFK